ncbi:hypothetical protein [Bradyrhizobium sp. HKCCYLR20261]|uniref:hypothetical protein n=1 Tax=Bradyrhizobium sp. HKCCYLR20261 TaxID=3420760 RepID=UPI003EBC75D4
MTTPAKPASLAFSRTWPDRRMQQSLDETIRRRRAAPLPYASERFEGRGIVICAGGVRYFTCAWVLIWFLRRVHQVALPIQVWHLGQGEMSEEMRLLLLEEGVEVVDAETIAARHPARLAGGWPLKPYAIANSRFREVLFLDADTVPLADPQQAFQWSDYLETGLLLWPDNVDIKATNPIWARIGLAPAERVSVDSGIMLVDKARAWDILDLALAMNEHSDELYALIHGDKDTFLLAAMLLQRRFGMIAHRPFAFEWDMVQRDPSGDQFLHHRCGAKWLLHLQNRPLAVPALMPECEAALADLRARWTGRVFHAPPRSTRALAEEARLTALRRISITTEGHRTRVVELLPGHVVGAGRNLEQHWAVSEERDTLQLQFYRDLEPIATLHAKGKGVWYGLGDAPGTDFLVKELGDAAADDAPPPVRRTIPGLVGAFLQPDWFAAGYDAKLADAIHAALYLLNDTFEDVPEQIEDHIAKLQLTTSWRGTLSGVARDLAALRDRRQSLVQRCEQERPAALDPLLYGRAPSGDGA